MIATSGPAARPTVPGRRSPGGRGLDVIWWDASVMPYASITGAPKRPSSSAITWGGSGAEDDLMNRSRALDAAPGSDAKATIPLVVLPLIIFAIIVTTQFVMLLMSSVVLLTSGLAGTTWTRFNLFQQSLILLYSLIALALWTAPIYGWLLLVSSWARRATFLWAVLPFFAISVLEKIAFNSSYFASMLRYRFMDFASEAFVFDPHSKVVASVTQLTPGRFLSTPGLWTGLAFAALCIAAAVRLRRNRDPI